LLSVSFEKLFSEIRRREFLGLKRMIVGTEWLVEAFDCEAARLCDIEILRAFFARLVDDLNLKTIGTGVWHKFDGAGGGVTGLLMLTESHIACHTYPEHKTATFNLYCCRARREWNWEENLKELLGARNVKIQKIERGSETTSLNSQTRIDNRKSKTARGEQ
jgi:S-adenosylmethionine decarboxylase